MDLFILYRRIQVEDQKSIATTIEGVEKFVQNVIITVATAASHLRHSGT